MGMFLPQPKAFCVIEFPKTESATIFQRTFLTKFGVRPPERKDVVLWHRQFVEEGCLCKGESPSRPRVWMQMLNAFSERWHPIGTYLFADT